MKVLLLNPPCRDDTIMVKEGRCMQRKAAWGYIMAPVTMVTIATLLRNHSQNVSVMDCPADSVNYLGMLETVARIDPDIVFINTSTPTIDEDLHAAATLKRNSLRTLITVLFGIHPSCQYKELLSPDNGIDYCIIGEPEITAHDLANALTNGINAAEIDGLAFLDSSGSLIVTRERKLIEDLDTLPIPDWSLVNINNYRLPLNNERFLLINTNRGCPFRCTFCNAYVYYGRTPRHRSVAHIMQELHNNAHTFGVSNFLFWAEEFILDKPFVRELCHAIINSGLRIKWVCNSRVDAVDQEILSLIKRAGCWNIAFGIESGTQKILDRINKNITLPIISNAVTIAKNAGLQVTGHVILGFPTDTLETMKTTEEFINSLALDFVQYYCAIPYPGTELYAEALQNGWLTTTDWQKWEHNSSVLDYDHLTAVEIMQQRRNMLRRHYFKPGNIVNTLRKNIRRPADLFSVLSRIRGFLRWM